MPFPQAKPLHVSALQQDLLQQMAHRATSAQRLVKRAQIILEALNPRDAQRDKNKQALDGRLTEQKECSAEIFIEGISSLQKPGSLPGWLTHLSFGMERSNALAK